MNVGSCKQSVNRNPSSSLSRRDWLRLGAGAILSMGVWPGCARWSDRRPGGTFHFAVINDTHFQSPQCPAWFQQVSASIRGQSSAPEFCLMVGDLSEHGTQSELGPMREVLQSLQMPSYVVIGNHDHLSNQDRSVWGGLYPHSLNYHFEHRGWQFIGLDSCEGTRYENTNIQPLTLAWLDDTLPRLDPARPTVIFTHFPLGADVPMRPLNADSLLERFLDFNLVAVFNGHYHGLTQRKTGLTTLTTNRCCAISRNNHDGTSAKGYFLCTAEEGQIRREFVEVSLS